MSRKDLSRTVIEGGRSHRNVFDRRHSHRTERARVRTWLDKASHDVEEAEASVPRHRPRVHKGFSDKLGPAHRWLESQVGRPWSKVHAELIARFDARTTAGRHILHDHLLSDGAVGGMEGGRFRPEFVVDARGILRRSLWYRPTWRRLVRETEAWAAGRRAVLTHRGWWWVQIRGDGPPCRDWRCPLRPHERAEGALFHLVRNVPDRAMSRADVRRLFDLPEELRVRIVLRARVDFP